MSCDEKCKKFGSSQKFYASLSVGLIAMVVFLLFSSNLSYKLTGLIGVTPGTVGVIVHSVVAGLVAVLVGYLIMQPWKEPTCSCPPVESE